MDHWYQGTIGLGNRLLFYFFMTTSLAVGGADSVDRQLGYSGLGAEAENSRVHMESMKRDRDEHEYRNRVLYEKGLVDLKASDQSKDGCLEFVGHWPQGATKTVAYSGGYAYFGNGSLLMVADVSAPASPTVTGSVVIPGGSVEDVAVAGNYAYVAADAVGLRIIDISNPNAPSEVGYYDASLNISDAVAISGNYAYVGDASKLEIIDVSNPSTPVKVGEYDAAHWIEDVVVAGNYAYLAERSYGLSVIDISNPTTPTEVGSYATILDFGEEYNDLQRDAY